MTTPQKRYLNKSRLLKLTLLLPLFLVLFYNLFYWNRILPGIEIGGVKVGGLLPEKAESLLAEKISLPPTLTLLYNQEVFKIPLENIGYKIDYRKTIFYAYKRYRTGNILYDLIGSIHLLRRGENLGVEFDLDQNKLEEYLSVIRGGVETPGKEPQVAWENERVIIEKGRKGLVIDQKLLDLKITENLTRLSDSPIEIPTKEVGFILSEREASKLYQTAEKISSKSLLFEYNLFSQRLSGKELVSLLNYDATLKTQKAKELIEEIKKQINSEPQNALFVFKENRVEEFKPAKEGVSVDEEKLSMKIKEAFGNLILEEGSEIKIEIPVIKTPPKIKTEDVNNLGIKELLGRGISKFAGSIPSRIHNIGLASSKFNGVLIEPGKEVSFNEILGDVSTYTGYKQAYIIKDGKTILGDGGGVCQVSTTLFRAILSAGLPIIERRAHSYRVGYYEQDSPPGFDATVFSPTTDLKFKNDTPAYLLIQTIFDPQKHTLIFEIYGTNDGRVAKVSKPVVTNVTAPPEDLYIDDPTLPLGKVKQIEHKAWGAKVVFNYKVERNGEIIFEKTFVSNYQPWRAVFLRGSGSAGY